MKKVVFVFIISLFISITSYAQENSKKETSLKIDSIKQMMKNSYPDLWKKYRRGDYLKYKMGSNYFFGGGLVVTCGLIINLSTNSQKQTAEIIDNQKRIGNNLIEGGCTLAAIGILVSIIGSHKQKVAIRDCTKRTQNRQAELQFGIMPSGGLGLALKF